VSEELAWAAGLFDGEGSVGTYGKSGRSYFHLRVSIGQQDRRVLDRFVSVVGLGKTYGPYSTPHGKERWEYQIAGGTAREVMDLIWPWLSEPKRLQAERAYQELADGPQPQKVGDQGRKCPEGCTCGRHGGWWNTHSKEESKSTEHRRKQQRENMRRYRAKKKDTGSI
jgi:hypothetical protein